MCIAPRSEPLQHECKSAHTDPERHGVAQLTKSSIQVNHGNISRKVKFGRYGPRGESYDEYGNVDFFGGIKHTAELNNCGGAEVDEDVLKKVQNAEDEAAKQAAVQQAAVQQAAVRVAYNDFLQRHAMESHQKVFDPSTLDAIAQISKTHGGGTRQPGRSETNPLVRPIHRHQPQRQRPEQEQAPVAESEGYFHG